MMLSEFLLVFFVVTAMEMLFVPAFYAQFDTILGLHEKSFKESWRFRLSYITLTSVFFALFISNAGEIGYLIMAGIVLFSGLMILIFTNPSDD